MDKSSLTPSSYIVLGFLDRCGSMTSYDLKQWADGSVGYFWSFSRAQLYKEPVRLTKLGLISETKETDGRKRRVYKISRSGKSKLRSWLKESSQAPTEIRDIGLLKLYFSDPLGAKDLQILVRDQIASHKKRLGEYESIERELSADPSWSQFLETVEMGLRFERMAIGFWEDLASK